MESGLLSTMDKT